MSTPGMTAQNTLETQPTSFKSAVFINGLDGILAAGRRVTAGIGQQGTNGGLVELDECYGDALKQFCEDRFVLSASQRLCGQ